MDGSTMTISVASAVAGYVGQRVLDAAVDRFALAVIRPCSERRAREYFRKLAEVLAPEPHQTLSEDAISKALDRVAEHHTARETAFEFYRQAVLSRSKELGPRILAILAAGVIRDNRTPTAAEQQLADVAETCTDDELTQFTDCFRKITDGVVPKGATKVTAHENEYVVELGSDSGSSVFVSELNLSVEMGVWAAKLERAGVIVQHVETGSRARDRGEEKWDWTPEPRHYVVSSVVLREPCKELAKLVAMARHEPT